MTNPIPALNVCLNTKHRIYRPDSRIQNRRELGIHGTRQQIMAAYGTHLDIQYALGDIRPSDLMEIMDNIEPCRCPHGKPCTTTVLQDFIYTKLDELTSPTA